MSTTPAPSSTASTTSSTQKIGLIVELSGLAAFITGAVLSLTLHHYAIAALILGGIAAVAVGNKLRKG